MVFREPAALFARRLTQGLLRAAVNVLRYGLSAVPWRFADVKRWWNLAA
jgi:hypothetical protein